MREPDWDALPFSTDGTRWRAYAQTETAVEALALVQRGEGQLVWIENAACAAFAGAAGVDHGTAFVELGAGVLRWLPGSGLREGQAFAEVRFRGAPAVRLCVGKLNGQVVVHLPHEIGVDS